MHDTVNGTRVLDGFRGTAQRRRWLPGVVAAAVLAAGCAMQGADDVSSNPSDLTLCAAGETLRGVDVSSYQGAVNWPVAHAAGIAFGFAKSTEGLTIADRTFAANWSGMRAAGVARGAYHFFHPGESATAQARFMLSTVGPLDAADLPMVLDFEVMDGVPEATAVASAVTFLQTVTAATGKTAILYMSAGFLSRSYPALAPYPLWVANYGVSCPRMPPGRTAWRFWQDGESGTVAGIPGTTDTDVFNGSMADFVSEFGGTGPGSTGTTPDAGTVTPTDAGTVTPTDAGTVTPTDAGTVTPTDAGHAPCTLAGASHVEHTCTESQVCVDGRWIPHGSDPTGCVTGIAPGGACFTDTGDLVPQATCTPSLQCNAGVWVDRMSDPAPCLGATRTSCDLGGATWPQNTCTATLQCDSGSWIARSSDPMMCNTGIAPAGACLTDVGGMVAQNTCTTTLQCDLGVWVHRSSDPMACR